MEAFTIVAVWFTSLVAGGLLVLGLTTIVKGRAVINLHRTDWSIREARLLGLCTTVQGIAFGAYALYGGLSLGAHVIPLVGVGLPWGMFVPAPFWLVFFGAMAVQAVIEHRHERAEPSTMR
jgi:hypothetical protein